MFFKRVFLTAATFAAAFVLLSAELPQKAFVDIFADADYQTEQSDTQDDTQTEIMFDAAGGKCEVGSLFAECGEPLGELPLPVKNGFIFEGWFDEYGVRYDETSICPQCGTLLLTAEWTPITCQLRFDPCGGSVTSRQKSYTAGKKLGALPVARKNGYTFKGWYTSKKGGTRVSYSTILKDVKDRTFYAHYAKPSFATLRYSFANSFEDFGYKFDYTIPFNTYDIMFDRDYALYIYDEIGRDGWQGNCFGMSATSAFLNTGKLKVQSFNKKEYFIKELSLDDEYPMLGMDVRQFIECMQVAQYSPLIQQKYNDNFDEFSKLVTEVKKCADGSGKPVVVALLGDQGGHAVLAYKWKKISAEKERIYIYDCNYPKDSNAYITLYKRNGKYITCGYEMFSDLTFFKFSDIWKVWNERDDVVSSALISTNAASAELYSADGTLCARIDDSQVVSDDEEIFGASLVDVTADKTLIFLPAGDYTLVTDDKNADAQMYCNGDILTAEQSGGTFVFDAY